MASDDNPQVLNCPSYAGRPGAQLLGVRQKDGNIAILPKPITPADDFFEVCKEKEIVPEEHFRFTGKCEQSNCAQWQDHKCAVAIKAVALIDDMTPDEPLPVCGIRPFCVWFKQEKSNACRMCKLVITEISV